MSSYVLVALDTLAPAVSVTGAMSVTPPEDIVLTLTASEDIGWTNLSFIDSVGESHDVGFEVVDSRTRLIRIPTGLMSTGPGVLRSLVADTVENLVVTTTTISVGTTRPFDVVIEFGHAFNVDLGLYHPFDVTTSIGQESSA